jgi:thiosulfate/3-mercaptopyruvate sulfurtransferase
MMYHRFTVATFVMAVACAAAAGGDTAKPAYPRADLLIEAPALAAKVKDFRILDVRPKAKYDQGHIPGALNVDPGPWAKAFAAGQDPKEWADRIGNLGIDRDSHVVLYDDGKVTDAARLWWILRYFGLKDARLLNGGFAAWKAAGAPTSTKTTAVHALNVVIAKPSAGRLATKKNILTLLDAAKKPQLIDARSEGEHCGTTKLAKRGGAIPGSLHLEWSDTLDSKTRKFKSAAELAKLFKDAGINLNRPAITYCQSGGRAAVMAFALELMGARDVANYYRSWSEWGNATDTPVEQKK